MSCSLRYGRCAIFSSTRLARRECRLAAMPAAQPPRKCTPPGTCEPGANGAPCRCFAAISASSEASAASRPRGQGRKKSKDMEGLAGGLWVRGYCTRWGVGGAFWPFGLFLFFVGGLFVLHLACFGLSLFSRWSIGVAPVRGGTYFLCRRKESKQRKRAYTASL